MSDIAFEAVVFFGNHDMQAMHVISGDELLEDYRINGPECIQYLIDSTEAGDADVNVLKPWHAGAGDTLKVTGNLERDLDGTLMPTNLEWVKI